MSLESRGASSSHRSFEADVLNIIWRYIRKVLDLLVQFKREIIFFFAQEGVNYPYLILFSDVPFRNPS